MKLDKNQIGLERIFIAPIELVWKMWSEPQHIQHWWGPNGFRSSISVMEFQAKGNWIFTMHGPDGTDYANHNMFKEIVFQEKIVIVHTGPPFFDISVYFEKIGEKTKLKLITTFESEEAMIEILKNGIVAEGLKQNLDKLETYVPTSGDIVIKKIFEAPLEKVWQAISDKDQMKMWYFDLPEFNAEIGCEFSFIGGSEGGIQYIHQCKVTELETNKKIAYTWKYEGYNGVSTVIWELEKIGNQTLLTLTHKNIESFPSNNQDLAKKNFAGGWDSIINSSLFKFLNS